MDSNNVHAHMTVKSVDWQTFILGEPATKSSKISAQHGPKSDVKGQQYLMCN